MCVGQLELASRQEPRCVDLVFPVAPLVPVHVCPARVSLHVCSPMVGPVTSPTPARTALATLSRAQATPAQATPARSTATTQPAKMTARERAPVWCLQYWLCPWYSRGWSGKDVSRTATSCHVCVQSRNAPLRGPIEPVIPEPVKRSLVCRDTHTHPTQYAHPHRSTRQMRTRA